MQFRSSLRVLLSIVLVLSACGAASAHKTAFSPDGKVKIVWGFLNEPAVTMTKTGLDLILSDNATGAPIDGVSSSTLMVEMHKGEAEMEFKDFKAQFGQHGRYTGVVTLTQPGIYVLHLTGTINGSEMGTGGLEIPAAHEVDAIETTYFPAINATSPADFAKLQSDVKALQDQVAALSAKISKQSQTPASVVSSSPAKAVPGFEAGVGIAALGIVALAAVMRRRVH